jgi:hypothetical protein
MRNFSLVICCIFTVFSVNAQRQNQAQIEVENQQRQQRQFERIRNISAGIYNKTDGLKPVSQNISKLYRKPTEKELKILSPENEDLQKFAAFLQQPNTGITKLVKDYGCAENPGVVVGASADCLTYTMPGAGSSYSFRTNNYQIRRLSDLTYTGNSFQSTGIMLHGLLVNIGDIPLEDVSAATKGAEFLINFEPAKDLQTALKIDSEINGGIKKEDFLYRRNLAAQENTTYLLRSIAYKGKLVRVVQGITFNELDFDKRKDVIIAFRVVRRDADSTTIIWKELDSKKAPGIKVNDKRQNLEIKNQPD